MGISGSLAESLWGSGNEGGGGTGVSGDSETISVWGNTVSIWSISVVSVEGIGISISTSLSVASIACGLAVGGAHSWPVWVGVEEGGGGNGDIAGISLGGDSDSNTSGNQEFVHFE